VKQLSGRVAVVTGGGSGIGEALARGLAAVMMPRTRPPAEQRFQELLQAIHRGERPNPWED